MPVGVDVVSALRVADDIRRWGERFTGRLLTPAEAAWCAAEAEPERAVAGCLAAKEAVVKVLGGRPKGFAWTSVELIPDACAGDRGECRALIEAADGGQFGGEVVGLWRCTLAGHSVPHQPIEAAAVTRGPLVIAVAAA